MIYSLDQIDWCNVPLVPPMHDSAWDRESAQRIGKPTYVAQFVTPVRWLLVADELMHQRVTSHVPVEFAMLVNLIVAMDNSCRHCYGAFRSMLKIAGYSEKAIRALEENLALAELSPRDKLALEFSRHISQSDPRPASADLDKLAEAGYSRIEIAELVYLAANGIVGNRLATLLALPPDPVEKMEGDWMQRVIRPFTRASFRESLGRVWSADGEPVYSGPGSPIVDQLRGSPAANALASTLDSIWSSEITSKRVKALILAVIAHGLGCPVCETEAARTFREEGWDDEEFRHLLAHLKSDRLDPFELKVLHFARETTRHRPRRVQDLAREFGEGMDREVLVEIVGLVSYFNGLARMSLLLDHS